MILLLPAAVGFALLLATEPGICALPASAQQASTVATVGGVCEQVLVAGKQESCVPKPRGGGSGVIYVPASKRTCPIHRGLEGRASPELGR